MLSGFDVEKEQDREESPGETPLLIHSDGEKDKGSPNHDQKFYRPINFATGLLIQKWCRHQYLKGLLPSLMVIWYFCFIFLAVDYERKATNYIRQESINHNCSIIQTETLTAFPVDCTGLQRDIQYYHVDNQAIGTQVTVNCTLDGASFFYDKSYWGLNQNGYLVQIILNFIAPIIFTYFIYETCYLALYDCLVIIPGLDEKTGEPILRYCDGPFRVSWFVLREMYQYFYQTKGKSSESHFSARRKPGIRIGYISSLCINCFIVLSVTTTTSFTATNGNVYQCTDESDYALTTGSFILGSLLAIYLSIVLIPTFSYYYRLFFQIRDLELVATKYSRAFFQLRYAGCRNLFDIFPTLLIPLIPNLFYYTIWILPSALIYALLKAVFLLFRKKNHREGRLDILEQSIDRFYERYVFNLSDRWWCRWFIRSIDEEELVSWRPLPPDDDLE